MLITKITILSLVRNNSNKNMEPLQRHLKYCEYVIRLSVCTS